MPPSLCLRTLMVPPQHLIRGAPCVPLSSRRSGGSRRLTQLLGESRRLSHLNLKLGEPFRVAVVMVVSSSYSAKIVSPTAVAPTCPSLARMLRARVEPLLG